MEIAKFDISNDIFKTVPAAALFIKEFKTNLTGDEIDWSLRQEQDATEFIYTFFTNIDRFTKATMRSFFKSSYTKNAKKMITFVRTRLSIEIGKLMQCNCGAKRWGKAQQEMSLKLKFPTDAASHSIQDLIDDYQRMEQADNVACCKCKKNNQMSQRLILKNSPQYLLLAFERNKVISWNPHQRKKITHAIDLDEIIEVKVNNSKQQQL